MGINIAWQIVIEPRVTAQLWNWIVWSVPPWNPFIKTVQEHLVWRLELKGSCYKMNGWMGYCVEGGQCRAGGEGAWPPRAERGVKGQHAPALHCIYNPRHEYYPTALNYPLMHSWCSTTVRRALIPLFPRHDNVFITARTLPPISILWTGRARHQRRCSWPTIYPRLSGRACLQTPHLRDHSLPWFLSDHPDACCLIFLSREFIFSWQLYYEVSVFTDLQLFFLSRGISAAIH